MRNRALYQLFNTEKNQKEDNAQARGRTRTRTVQSLARCEFPQLEIRLISPSLPGYLIGLLPEEEGVRKAPGTGYGAKQA